MLANLALQSRLPLIPLFFHSFFPLIFPRRNLRHDHYRVDAAGHDCRNNSKNLLA